MERGGNFWSAWTAWCSFFRDVCDLDIAEWAAFAALETTQSDCGTCSLHHDFAMVSDRPATLLRDAEGRLHCADGPAIAWRDGWSLHFWHGTKVPAEWIMRRETLTGGAVLAESNLETRRAGVEMLGWPAILKDLNARTIDADADPEIGTLIEVDLPDLSRPARFLLVRCGTGREFALGVPPTITTALDAQAWMAGLSETKFKKPEIRT